MPHSNARIATIAATASVLWAVGSCADAWVVQAAEQTHPGETRASIYHEVMETHPSQGDVRAIDGAEAVLLTTADGAFVSVDTKELTPGNVHTLWWVVINEPEACAASPCGPPDVLEKSAATKADVTYGDSIIVEAKGEGRFNGFLPAGDLPNSWFGNGFQNPQGAEIHLVINDHGPLIADLAPSMLNSYRGGCTDESIPAAFPDTAKSDGEPGPNTCRLVQDVIFIQDAGVVATTEPSLSTPAEQ